MVDWSQIECGDRIYQIARCAVYRCQYQGNPYVFKELKFRSEEEAERAISEVHIQQMLSKAQICKVVDYTTDYQTYLWILLESMDRDLDAEIKLRTAQNNYWSCDELIAHFYILIAAFATAQSMQICHRDIKPQNILVRAGQLYVADFGCAKQTATDAATSLKGSLYFLSPELKVTFLSLMSGNAKSIIYNPYKSDVYSLGLTFMFMWHGRESTELTKLQVLAENTEMVLSGIWNEEVNRLLTKMLTVDPHCRPDFKHLLDEILAGNSELLSRVIPLEASDCSLPRPQFQLLRRAVFEYWLIPRVNSGDPNEQYQSLLYTFSTGANLAFECTISRCCYFCTNPFAVEVSVETQKPSYWFCSEECAQQYYRPPVEAVSQPVLATSQCFICQQYFLPSQEWHPRARQRIDCRTIDLTRFCSYQCMESVYDPRDTSFSLHQRVVKRVDSANQSSEKTVKSLNRKSQGAQSTIPNRANRAAQQQSAIPARRYKQDTNQSLSRSTMEGVFIQFTPFNGQCLCCKKQSMLSCKCPKAKHMFCAKCADKYKSGCRICKIPAKSNKCCMCEGLVTNGISCSGRKSKGMVIIHSFCDRCAQVLHKSEICPKCKKLES